MFSHSRPSPEWSSVSIDARRRLSGLWVPAASPSGKILPNLAGPDSHLNITGLWSATVGGVAVAASPAANFGKPHFPLTSQPRPYSIWYRAVRSTAALSVFVAQYLTAAPDNMEFFIQADGKIQYRHGGDLISLTSVGLGEVFSAGVVNSPGQAIRLYLNGRLDRTGAASTGRCSTTNAALGANASAPILALAIWIGRALTSQDMVNLHLNPNLLQKPSENSPVPSAIVPPSGIELPANRRIEWPNRPWWRRWSFRKRNY